MALLALALVTGCGADGGDGQRTHGAAVSDGCLNCGAPSDEEEVVFQATPRLWVFPDSLMFYADIQTPEIAPQDTVLSNTTTHPALITNVFVVNQDGNRGGDAAFFAVDEVPEDTELVSNGALNVKVRFNGSTQQRTAWLVINTTHPSYPQLTVSLTGKYFLNDGNF